VTRLATDPELGLSLEAIAELRERSGLDELPAVRRRPLWAVVLGQFRSPLIYLLFGAAAIAFALGEIKDAIVIFVVVLLNAAIGGYQEGRAENALAALRRLSSQKAHVVRSGREQILDARELVPGDLIVLAAGDAVTADVRLSSGVPFAVVRTETFTLLAVCEWFNVVNCLSDRRSALGLGVLRSRWAGS
jgi:Ca2+-transporting ATPase